MAQVTGNPTLLNMNTVTAPAFDHFAITPSDSTNFNAYARGIYVGVGGDVVVVSPAGNAVTYKNVPTGAILPVIAIRVNSTSTTATNMVGFV
jgi:hypothetical protein